LSICVAGYPSSLFNINSLFHDQPTTNGRKPTTSTCNRKAGKIFFTFVLKEGAEIF